MYIDERLLKILETHKGETADVNFIISLIKTIAKEYETEQLIIGGVINTFKAQIQSDIEEAKRTLKSTKENTAYSFEDASGWVEEMNLIKGEIQGLTKALNYC